jgi:hypothetical protein
MEYFWPLFWGFVVLASWLVWIFADPYDPD